jgi:hypothetical protein
MAQLVATGWLVFPWMKEDFRVCLPLLARGDGASATLNHQNWTRADLLDVGGEFRRLTCTSPQAIASHGL